MVRERVLSNRGKDRGDTKTRKQESLCTDRGTWSQAYRGAHLGLRHMFHISAGIMR